MSASLLGGKDAHRGRASTGVTEVTEGDCGLEGERALVESIASGRERCASGESIAQRSRRGIEDWRAEGLLVDCIASGREKRASGKSIAQRARRSQRGIEDWRAQGLWWNVCGQGTALWWMLANCSSSIKNVKTDVHSGKPL